MALVRVDGFTMHADTDMERYRAETILTKEPETIEWLDRMQPGDILHDVGANIGIYALYAAARGLTVHAYEPVIENCMRLQENIDANGYANAHAYNIAIGGASMRLCRLHLPDRTIGSSGAQIGEPVDEHGREFEPIMSRNIITMSLWEAFVLESYVPMHSTGTAHHVKVDVDGHEKEVCDGMRRLLRGQMVRSVLVEVNTGTWPLDDARAFFRAYDYTDDNRYNRCERHSRYRRRGTASEKAENVVYVRSQG